MNRRILIFFLGFLGYIQFGVFAQYGDSTAYEFVAEPGIYTIEPGFDLMAAEAVAWSGASFISSWKSANNIIDYSSEVGIFLKTNPLSDQYEAPYQCTVKVNLKFYDANGVLTLYDANPTTLGINDPLELLIDYDGREAKKFSDSHVFSKQGDYIKIEAEILSINFEHTSAGTSPSHTFPNNALVGVFIKSKRKAKYDKQQEIIGQNACYRRPKILPISNYYNIDNKHLEVKIEPNGLSGIQYYELEWLHIDDLDATVSGVNVSPITPGIPRGSLKANFRHNASKVIVNNSADASFKIPVVYNSGYIVVRVRAVGFDENDPASQIYGNWTISNGEFPLDRVPDAHLFHINGNQTVQQKLNWTYELQFAEGPKVKPSISYFDGLLRKRQSLSLNNTDEVAIIQEDIYDHVGRPIVSFLPVPISKSSLALTKSRLDFIPAFNRPSTVMVGAGFTWRNFESKALVIPPAESCIPFSSQADSEYGASNYYSEANSRLVEHQNYLPNANGFPYTQTVYTPDNTGRIRRKGGVGYTHQIGNGHDTQYYYMTPSQEELDALFGTDVGYASHYQKQAVLDPNGTLTTTYLNRSGQVIATALVGDVGGTSHAASGQTSSSSPLTHNLSSFDVVDSERGISETNYSFLVTQNNADVILGYELSQSQLSICTACYECVYDYRVELVDECGSYVFEPEEISNIGTVLNGTNCGPLDSWNWSKSLTLDKGQYRLMKRLSVSRSALTQQLNQYLADTLNGCLRTYNSFLSEAIAKLDFSGCEPSCAQCESLLPSGESPEARFLRFKRKYLGLNDNEEIVVEPGQIASVDAGTQSLIEETERMCKTICGGLSSCDQQRLRMEAEVSPQGKYFIFRQQLNVPTQFGTFNEFGDFTPNGQSDGALVHNRFKNPVYNIQTTDFTDEDGQLVFVDANNAPQPLSSITIDEIIQEWRPHWAKFFVKLHPEYCMLEFCDNHLSASADYDAKMNKIQNYNDAMVLHLLDPLGISLFTNTSNSSFPRDPFFDEFNQFPTPAQHDTLISRANIIKANTKSIQGLPGIGGAIPYSSYLGYTLQNFLEKPSSTPSSPQFYTIWEVALMNSVCQDPAMPQSTAGIENCISNYSLGKPLVQGSANMAALNALTPAQRNRFWTVFRGLYQSVKHQYIRLFRYVMSEGACNDDLIQTENPYKANNIPANFDISDEATIREEALNRIQGQAYTTCWGYVPTWERQLESCLSQVSNMTRQEIMYYFAQICAEGTDPANPFGASTLPSNRVVAHQSEPNVEFRSFLEVLQYFIPNYGEQPYGCTPALVDFPAPHGTNYFAQVKAEQEGCNTCLSCSTVATAWQNFHQTYGITELLEDDTLYERVLTNTLNQQFGFSLSYSKYAWFYGGCPQSLDQSNNYIHYYKPLRFGGSGDVPDPDAVLCNEDLFPRVQLDEAPCSTQLMNLAKQYALIDYRQYMEEKIKEFDRRYLAHCIAANQSLTLTLPFDGRHFTLYYYDQSGQLVQTIPPKGVSPITDAGILTDVRNMRACSSTTALCNRVLPAHELPTTYAYNTLNQVIMTQSPDAGKAYTWYDPLGRPVLSATDEDIVTRSFKYTKYDGLSRVVETGYASIADFLITALHGMAISSSPPGYWSVIRSPKLWNIGFDPTAGNLEDGPVSAFFYNSPSRRFVTQTDYDRSTPLLDATLNIANKQQYLRNRVAASRYYKQFPHTADSWAKFNHYDRATFFSYDIHGNVDLLWQDERGNGTTSNTPIGELVGRIKSIRYTYDLISGNVWKVLYQPGGKDHYEHLYTYDADNRLEEVRTARHPLHHDRDAIYRYYEHGPLARTELGEWQVQGLDYAYTLHGWIKTVNGSGYSGDYQYPDLDMGRDGWDNNANFNKRFGRDAFAYSLHYYDYNEGPNGQRDYVPVGISKATNPVVNPLAPWNYTGGAGKHLRDYSLYNGNIAAMTTAMPKAGSPVTYGYEYDELNRLRRVLDYESWDPNAGSPQWTAAPATQVSERFDYDPNGNITQLTRRAQQGFAFVDSLHYTYTAGTNRLERLQEVEYDYNNEDNPNGGITLGTREYTYDLNGSLVEDDAPEGNTTIEWSPTRKPLKVTTFSGTVIEYEYDGFDRRALKRTKRANDTLQTVTRYVYDPQGNVLATYTVHDTTARLLGNYAATPTLQRITHLEHLYQTDAGQLEEILQEWLSGQTNLNEGYWQNATVPCCTSAACTSINGKVSQFEYVLSTALTNRDWDCIQQIIRELNMGDFFDRLEAANLPTEMTNWPKKESAMSAKLDEHHIYGSARLGVDNRDMLLHRTTITLGYNPWTQLWSLPATQVWNAPPLDPNEHTYTRGNKRYELSNHLGNVLAVITDKKVIIGADGDIDAYHPDVAASQDYYAFGSIRTDRRYKRVENNGKDKITGRFRLHSVDVGSELELIFPGQQPTPGNGVVYDLNFYSSIEQYIDDIVLGMQSGPGVNVYRDGIDLVIELDPTLVPVQPYCDYPVYVAVNSGVAIVKTIEQFQCGKGLNRGYNGMENEEEIYGEGNMYYTLHRMLDTRYGRWLTVDPVIHEYESPYVSMHNIPTKNIDPDGNCPTCPLILGAAVVNAVFNYSMQVAVNMADSKLSTRQIFFDNVDITDVGLAALEGAAMVAAPGGLAAKVTTAFTFQALQNATNLEYSNLNTPPEDRDEPLIGPPSLLLTAAQTAVSTGSSELIGNAAKSFSNTLENARQVDVANINRTATASPQAKAAARQNVNSLVNNGQAIVNGTGIALTIPTAYATNLMQKIKLQRQPAASNATSSTAPALQKRPLVVNYNTFVPDATSTR